MGQHGGFATALGIVMFLQTTDLPQLDTNESYVFYMCAICTMQLIPWHTLILFKSRIIRCSI